MCASVAARLPGNSGRLATSLVAPRDAYGLLSLVQHDCREKASNWSSSRPRAFRAMPGMMCKSEAERRAACQDVLSADFDIRRRARSLEATDYVNCSTEVTCDVGALSVRRWCRRIGPKTSGKFVAPRLHCIWVRKSRQCQRAKRGRTQWFTCGHRGILAQFAKTRQNGFPLLRDRRDAPNSSLQIVCLRYRIGPPCHERRGLRNRASVRAQR